MGGAGSGAGREETVTSASIHGARWVVLSRYCLLRVGMTPQAFPYAAPNPAPYREIR